MKYFGDLREMAIFEGSLRASENIWGYFTSNMHVNTMLPTTFGWLDDVFLVHVNGVVIF